MRHDQVKEIVERVLADEDRKPTPEEIARAARR